MGVPVPLVLGCSVKQSGLQPGAVFQPGWAGSLCGRLLRVRGDVPVAAFPPRKR